MVIVSTSGLAAVCRCYRVVQVINLPNRIFLHLTQTKGKVRLASPVISGSILNYSSSLSVGLNVASRSLRKRTATAFKYLPISLAVKIRLKPQHVRHTLPGTRKGFRSANRRTGMTAACDERAGHFSSRFGAVFRRRRTFD